MYRIFFLYSLHLTHKIFLLKSIHTVYNSALADLSLLIHTREGIKNTHVKDQTCQFILAISSLVTYLFAVPKFRSVGSSHPLTIHASLAQLRFKFVTRKNRLTDTKKVQETYRLLDSFSVGLEIHSLAYRRIWKKRLGTLPGLRIWRHPGV